jgi:hypothetical protein
MSVSEISTPSAPSGAAPAGFHRLSPKTSVRGGFFIAAIVAIVFTVITVLLIIGLYSGKSGADAPPLWLAGIFVLVDLAIIAWAIKSFLRWTMTGQTTVDVSSPAAFPGEPLEVIVSQPGQFAIDQCNVDLICEEAATYTAGTDTETKTEIVRTLPLCDLSGLTSRNGQMLTRQTVKIPADAMLTFNAPNNKITWMIRVKMTIPKRPDSEQLFPVRVLSRQIVALEGQKNG